MFLERLPNITAATRAAFERTLNDPEQIEWFVMLFGRLCVEDFHEIMVLCANGYGYAATKLIRALYEKAVTLDYLNDNPQELHAFLDYGHIAQQKLMTSVTDVFGFNILNKELQDQVVAEAKDVKDQFMVTDCEKCGTKRLNHTWTKLDIVSMSKRTRILGKLIVYGYYIPMRHTHSTAAALIERLETNEKSFGFNPDAQRKEADDALRTAHLILLEVLYIQQKRFTIEDFEQFMDRCHEDRNVIYGVDDQGQPTR